MKHLSTYLPENIVYDPFNGSAIASVIRTSQAQEEIWTACKLGGDNANKAYNESISLNLKGKLDHKALAQAVATLVERHESLRATFSPDGRFMSVLEQGTTQLREEDISKLSITEKDHALKSYLHKNAQLLFDLVNGPLFRAGLIKIAENEHHFVLTAHHIICDGWSFGIMLQELGALYSAFRAYKSPDLPKPKSFSAFADAQQELLESKNYENIERFWLHQYEQSVPQVDLPTDFERPAHRTYESARLDFPLDENLIASLKKTGLQAGCGLVTTLLASFEIFLSKLSGQNDLVVGLPAAGQSVSGMQQLIGHCANLLPLRTIISPDQTFTKYLKQRKPALFDAYDHQQLSFGHLLKKLPITRDVSRIPLVPVVFNIDLGLTDGVHFTDLTYTLHSNPRKFETFEIFLNATGSEHGLTLEWSYNTHLFKPDTIKKMMASFENLVNKLATQPNEILGEITEKDFDVAYADLNDTKVSYPETTLHKLLYEQALATPKRSALIFNGKSISYQNLHEQANQLANVLFEKGIRPGDIIGLSVPRSPEMLIALLAIMKCGAAYLPMDPTYPRPRLEFMLQDAEAQFCLTTREFFNSFVEKTDTLVLEDALAQAHQYPKTPPVVNVDQEAMAYILYTSGSTGKPKGVPITHKNFVNLLCSIAENPGILETDKLLAITTISFDIAGVELFAPLLKGACIVLADTDTVRDGRLLLELLKKEDITILQATPTSWQMLLDAGWEGSPQLKAFCTGETLPQSLADHLLPKCGSLWNLYGPTETTIFATLKQILKEDEKIYIGRPVANTQLYILNKENRLAARGTSGEICIGGNGVALGYWKRPELTQEKFIKNPLTPNGHPTLYRTGDLGILLPSGDVQCLGRLDEQVKIRGHRIEPAEIEQALTELDDIKAAVVLSRTDHLIAHIVPTKTTEAANKQIDKWRQALASQLPAHLVPREFRVHERFPVSPSGKLDRKALCETTITNETSSPYTAPRTEMEKLIAQIWENYLEVDKVDIFSDFFELGGHSLTAVQVMTKLEKEIGQRLPLTALFEYATIYKLAGLLDQDTEIAIEGALIPIKAQGTKEPLYLIRSVGLHVRKFEDLAKSLDDDQPVFGLQGIGVKSINESTITVENIAEQYIAIITKQNPNGPYALVGHSYGGIVAFEMARQLIKEGKKVSMLGLLDTYVEPRFCFSSSSAKKWASLGYLVRERISVLKEIVQSRERFQFRFKRKMNKIMKSGENWTKEQQYQQEAYRAVGEMTERIMKLYHLIPQDIEVDLFRANKKTFFMHDPIYLGWKNAALKGVNIHNIPGDHLDLIRHPYSLETARALQHVLDIRNAEN